jgi:hypothetical protein
MTAQRIVACRSNHRALESSARPFAKHCFRFGFAPNDSHQV